MKKITAIIPTYNHGHKISTCLFGLLSQSPALHQVIVIDDGSTDSTRDVVESYSCHYENIIYEKLLKNVGGIEAVNGGLELCTGDYVMFCGADDVILPGLISKAQEWLCRYPRAGVVCSVTALNDNRLIYYLGSGLQDHEGYLSPEMLVRQFKKSGAFIPSNTAIWNLEKFKNAGGFKPALRWHADTYALHKIAFSDGIIYLPMVYGIVSVDKNSAMQSGRKNKAEHRKVCLSFISDSAPFMSKMIESGMFYRLECDLWHILKNARHIITPVFLKYHIRHSLMVFLKPLLPFWFSRILVRRLKPVNRTQQIEDDLVSEFENKNNNVQPPCLRR